METNKPEDAYKPFPTEEELRKYMDEIVDPYPIEYIKEYHKFKINGPTFYGYIDADLFDEAMKEAAKKYTNDK